MNNTPLMPMATAVWLVENTTLHSDKLQTSVICMRLKYKV